MRAPIFFATQSGTFPLLTRIQQDIVTKVQQTACEVPLLLSEFNPISIFSTYFRQTLNNKIHAKLSSGNQVVPRGRTDGRTDGQTDRQQT